MKFFFIIQKRSRYGSNIRPHKLVYVALPTELRDPRTLHKVPIYNYIGKILLMMGIEPTTT
jgi:hypothetical protein